jgi:hypothetical protein
VTELNRSTAEHYREADELLNLSHRPSVWPWRRKALRERAQVHAILALVAALAAEAGGPA